LILFIYFTAFQFISHIHKVTGLPLYVNGTTGTLLLPDETLVGESERYKMVIATGPLSPTVSLEQYSEVADTCTKISTRVKYMYI